jgi:hypothetical protein
MGVLHSKEADKPKIGYSQRCEDLFQVQARLGPKIILPGVVKASDYDLWLECRNCGTVYPKHEVKVEPELEPIKEPSDGKQGKIQSVTRKKRTGRGNNPRIRQRDEIKDPDLMREIKDGAQLISYSSSDSL